MKIHEVRNQAPKPPRPDLPDPRTAETTEKNRRPIWVAVLGVLGVLVVLGIASTIVGDAPETAPPVASPAPIGEGTDPATPVVDEEIAAAATTSASLIDDAVRHLENGQRDLEAFDVDGAASELEAAADDYAELSSLWLGLDGEISSLSGAVADEFYAGADDLRAFELGSATRHMQAALALQEDLTARTEELAAEVA